MDLAGRTYSPGDPLATGGPRGPLRSAGAAVRAAACRSREEGGRRWGGGGGALPPRGGGGGARSRPAGVALPRGS